MKFYCKHCDIEFDQGDALELEGCSCGNNPPCSYCVDGDICPKCCENKDVIEIEDNENESYKNIITTRSRKIKGNTMIVYRIEFREIVKDESLLKEEAEYCIAHESAFETFQEAKDELIERLQLIYDEAREEAHYAKLAYEEATHLIECKETKNEME